MTSSRRILVLSSALALGLPGCDRGCAPSEPDDVLSLDATPPPGTANGLQVAPEPVLASIWIPNSMHPRNPGIRQPYAVRILRDGTVWYYTDVRHHLRPEDLEYDPLPTDLAWWYDGERLTPRETRILADAIRKLRLMDLPTEPPPPTETLIGTGEVLWTFSIDGLPAHDVRKFLGQPRPGLDRFDRLFNMATYRAQMRWQRDRGVQVLSFDPLPEP